MEMKSGGGRHPAHSYRAHLALVLQALPAQTPVPGACPYPGTEPEGQTLPPKG